MDNPQQYYPQTPLQQMPPVKKSKPLYKKWWFWTFMVCNTFVIGILFLTVVSTVDENLKYKAVLEEANEKISQLESQNPFSLLIDKNSEKITLLDKSFDFEELLNEKTLDNEKTVSYFAFYNYFMQSNIFYKTIQADADIIILYPIVEKYLKSAIYCVHAQYILKNIDKDSYDFLTDKLNESAFTFGQVMAPLLDGNNKLNEQSLNKMLDISISIDATIDTLIRTSIIRK